MMKESGEPHDPYGVRAVERSWRTVGGFLGRAMEEVSREIGGEDLVEQVSQAAWQDPDALLPDAQALRIMEEVQPGVGERVMDRMHEIGEETWAAERAELRNPFSKRSRAAILRGVVQLGGRDSS